MAYPNTQMWQSPFQPAQQPGQMPNAPGGPQQQQQQPTSWLSSLAGGAQNLWDSNKSTIGSYLPELGRMGGAALGGLGGGLAGSFLGAAGPGAAMGGSLGGGAGQYLGGALNSYINGPNAQSAQPQADQQPGLQGTLGAMAGQVGGNLVGQGLNAAGGLMDRGLQQLPQGIQNNSINGLGQAGANAANNYIGQKFGSGAQNMAAPYTSMLGQMAQGEVGARTPSYGDNAYKNQPIGGLGSWAAQQASGPAKNMVNNLFRPLASQNANAQGMQPQQQQQSAPPSYGNSAMADYARRMGQQPWAQQGT